jgi:radical SAM superfamily enzyme YgiQ (UPF0313 family)
LLKTEERTEKDPFIIVGGPCVYNPEPLADFFDLAVVGEGEEVMVELMEAYKKWKREGKPGGRQGFLRCAVKLKGIFSLRFANLAIASTSSSVSPGKPIIKYNFTDDQPAVKAAPTAFIKSSSVTPLFLQVYGPNQAY